MLALGLAIISLTCESQLSINTETFFILQLTFPASQCTFPISYLTLTTSQMQETNNIFSCILDVFHIAVICLGNV